MIDEEFIGEANAAREISSPYEKFVRLIAMHCGGFAIVISDREMLKETTEDDLNTLEDRLKEAGFTVFRQ